VQEKEQVPEQVPEQALVLLPVRLLVPGVLQELDEQVLVVSVH
jgi:hypothetical protein